MTLSEMPYVIDTSKIPQDGLTLEITSSVSQAEKIAQRLGIVRLFDFKSRVLITREGLITVRGTFTAQVVQKDVVTGEEVPESIEDSFEELFVDKKDAKESFPEENPDSPEVIENNQLDIGELLIQYLALSLNPFPRKQETADFVYREGDEKENPFSVLKKLKKD